MSKSYPHYSLVIAGTGFASTFFLQKYLRKRRSREPVLVLEAGPRIDHFQLVAERRALHQESKEHFANANPDKPWYFTRAFGGGSNCWFGSTPRMLPVDFMVRSRFGVGVDWPISYEQLEPYYCEAERIMQISGGGPVPYRMSEPYPLCPSRFSEPDQILADAHPGLFCHLPTARASKGGRRPACCNNGICNLCPIGAKFNIQQEMNVIFQQEGVELLVDSPLKYVLTKTGTPYGVAYQHDGRLIEVSADLIVLGANAIFNPAILLASGFTNPNIGRGLCEQVGISVMVRLERIKNAQGSTITTGIWYGDLLEGPRGDRAAAIVHTANRAMNLSLDMKAPFSTFELIVNFEDLPQRQNRVTAPIDGVHPEVHYTGHSSYAERGVRALPSVLEKLLAPLPVADVAVKGLRASEAHIQCTTISGSDAGLSVVDKHCVLHGTDNLVVLGSGTFPTASPANPSLTIAAQALWSADALL
jgi:choline dehydrogenase-like flavoprotein